ncbi:MAG TPA: alpha/beta hydrolase [Spirochaetota bacterium]|nr:alpha/beta hydrolase [Spirochaetota bacterium]HPI91316.1 alpha/beta hydrolase [Spirochaetota bacterium]HPR49046.1 alpha/beta hydrolase [Spirochaetota bacterium]
MPQVKINGLMITYDDKGPKRGTPLICVHGWTADRHRWDHQIDNLSKKTRVIRFDLRGHGESEKPSIEYTIDQLSDDLNALMSKLKIKKAVLAGHSMGGMTILNFALKYPEKVEKLILVDTIGKFIFSLGRKIIFLISDYTPFEFFVKTNIVRAFKKGFPKKRLEEFIALSQNTPQQVVMSFFRAMGKWNVLKKLKSITAPCLIIHGYYDIQFPLSQALKMALALPRATIKVVDSGHESPIEVPETITEAIRDFIQ